MYVQRPKMLGGETETEMDSGETEKERGGRDGAGKPPRGQSSKKKVSAPCSAGTFNCQNDACGTYVPVLVHLTRERALRDGIFVPLWAATRMASST